MVLNGFYVTWNRAVKLTGQKLLRPLLSLSAPNIFKKVAQQHDFLVIRCASFHKFQDLYMWKAFSPRAVS